MSVYRSALLRFADDGRALYDEDGLLAGGEIALVGDQYEITLAPLTARFFGITP